jgi:hypothetical protein
MRLGAILMNRYHRGQPSPGIVRGFKKIRPYPIHGFVKGLIVNDLSRWQRPHSTVLFPHVCCTEQNNCLLQFSASSRCTRMYTQR